MTLLVRNEADILRDNLEFHLAAGVDRFVVTDNGSQDATVEIARAYEARGLADVWIEPEDTYDQARWVTRMARFAAREHGADWVINNDADEFWAADGGSLPAALAALPQACEAVEVERHNFPPLAQMPAGWRAAMVYREANSLNALGAPLPGKLMHRGLAEVEVAMGNHDATAGGRPLRRCAAPAMEIHHFPVRSYGQFELKIAMGGAALARNATLTKDLGATWRRLYELWRAGGLGDWYAAQTLDPAALRAGLDSGALSMAATVRDRLEALQVPRGLARVVASADSGSSGQG